MFSRVGRSSFGMISPLQEEHLRKTRKRRKCKRRGQFQMLLFEVNNQMYFCPADDLSIFFVFWLLEHLRTDDGLHGFPINGTYNSGGHKLNWHNTREGYERESLPTQMSMYWWYLNENFQTLIPCACFIVLFEHKSSILRLPHETSNM